MRSLPLACLLLASPVFGLELKPSLAPSKPAAPVARPVVAAPAAPAPAAKPAAAIEPETPPVILAKFPGAGEVLANYKGIQVTLAGFVARGSRDFLDVKLVGAEGEADALCHVRLLDADGKAIGYLKAYLHAKGTSFDLAAMEKDPVKRRAVMERTQSIQFQGVDKSQAVLPVVCRRAK
jgi:hypothetical protein